MSKRVVVVIVAWVAWGSGAAMGRGLTVEEMVNLALKNNPTLSVAATEVQRARLAVGGLEHRYVPTLTVGAAYTHTETPSQQAGGSVSVVGSDAVVVDAGVHHTFSVGTTVGVEVELSGVDRSMPSVSGVVATDSGAAYGVTARASVQQPLLRGMGDGVGEAELRGAVIQVAVAELQQEQVVSELIRDVVVAYWTLWAAERTEQVGVHALEVAERRLAETDRRVQAGEQAPVDLLPLRTDVATQHEAVANARAARYSAKVDALRWMGLPMGEDLTTLGEDPPPVELPSGVGAKEGWVAEVVTRSWQIAQQDATIDAAKNQVVVAENGVDPRLDLSGWVQLDGLGARDAGGAFGMFGRGEAVSGYVGMKLELPLDRTEQKQELARAELAVTAARQKRVELTQNVMAEAEQSLNVLMSAAERLHFAEQTETVAKRAAEGQAIRFKEGDATATEVVLAEQSHREARLRVAKAKADTAIAGAKMDHLRGVLVALFDVTP